MGEPLRVVVIGAGIVGAFAARALVRDGQSVTIVDPGPPGGRQATSYGNGAWILESSLLPVSVPGLWRQVPGYLADPLGPFAIRWSHLWRAAPWLLRFVAAGSTVAKVEKTAAARYALTQGALGHYREEAAACGLCDLLRTDGLLSIYRDRADFEADALAWTLRARYGFSWQELEGGELHEFEPGLSADYGFGAHLASDANLTDPGAFVAGLVEGACRDGARLETVRATGFRFEGDRLRAVETEGGGEIVCDRALVTAGIHSRMLARQAGDRVPLETERGYHVVVPDPVHVPRHPIMPMDGKMAITMTRAGLRVAGQVELAGMEAEPDWRRADILAGYLPRVFPAFAGRMDGARIDRWMGHRPSTPDGLPCIGPSRRSPDVVYSFGHGHSGLAMGPISGRLAAELSAGRPPVVDPEPYGAQRFA
ncbi:FAD-binding oxidoreductase [Kaustia mangrovi]|uniref:FAD-binding oxidoreductase n=1 Tax=Kaustia mangrovi TaxID=2593653 RepID=A0A7S8C6Z7_9HYPH|nr:FAD-binding oxidoreductase [Kaustia mangrovi]QPC44568.1 FAD-binding oxidoreductase [Kaustia mangrovi]